MKATIVFSTTFAQMRSSPLRTFLTVLGIVIGVAAVTVVSGAGRGAQNLVLDQLNSLGSNLIGIIPGQETASGMPASALGIVTETLTNDDLHALRDRRNLPHVLAAAGYVTGNAAVKSDRYKAMVTFYGVSPDIVNVENIEVAEGRFFSSLENVRRSHVAVLGAERAREFFGDTSPLGRKISIKGRRFTVVGVLSPRGTAAFANQDLNIYVPLLVAQKNLLGIDYLNLIRLKVDKEENVPVTVEGVDKLLRQRHGIPEGRPRDFAVKDTVSALETLGRVTDVLTYLLIIVSAVSLLVGGIGVMNIMFIALSQRVREIGLRKAVGARRVDIVGQFLIEAVIISVVGGLIGVLLGVLTIILIAQVLAKLGYEYSLVIPFDAIGAALAVSLFIGIVFGAYPAYRAGRISPIEALRYE